MAPESSAVDALRASIDAVHADAGRLHAAGRLEQAEAQYRLLLALDEQHAAGWHYLGILLHQCAQHDEALACLQEAARLQPDQADWHNDTGNVLFALQRHAQAVAAYRRALALRPDDAQAWNNCGAALHAAGQDAEAIAAFLQALALAPDFAAPMQQLAVLYQQAGDAMRSAHYQCLAYVLPPHTGKSKELLGTSYYFLGRTGEAAQLCRQWLDEEPGHPIAAHMLAAYAGLRPVAAAAGYVERRFDDYADHFDLNLVQQLGYRGPDVVAALLAQVCAALPDGQGALRFDVLDAGCGTGLCAPVLAPHARRLDGVDLSENMLRHAAARQCYTQLEKAEAGAWMAARAAAYDLVVACDVVIYCGRLEDLFAAVRHSLRAGGHFIFTAEAAEEGSGLAPAGYLLHPSGRFRHHAAYLERCLRAAGFASVSLQAESIRQEMRQPVPGWAVLARA